MRTSTLRRAFVVISRASSPMAALTSLGPHTRPRASRRSRFSLFFSSSPGFRARDAPLSLLLMVEAGTAPTPLQGAPFLCRPNLAGLASPTGGASDGTSTGASGGTPMGEALPRQSSHCRATPFVLFLQFSSGVFFVFARSPLDAVLASIFPLRWLCQGMRSVFLPASYGARSWAGVPPAQVALVLGSGRRWVVLCFGRSAGCPDGRGLTPSLDGGPSSRSLRGCTRLTPELAALDGLLAASFARPARTSRDHRRGPAAPSERALRYLTG